MLTKLKEVDLVVCLDSSALSTDRVWITSSLRGIVNLDMTVKVLKDPVHSGDAGGIVPESFRICRELMDRIDLLKEGRMVDALQVKIPEGRIKEAKQLGVILGDEIYKNYTFLPGVHPEKEDLTELLLNRTWKPCLAVTGAEGLPPMETAGNVLRPLTTLRLSVRLPPTLESIAAGNKIKEILTKNPPYGCEVIVSGMDCSNGWNAKEFPKNFGAALDKVSKVKSRARCAG